MKSWLGLVGRLALVAILLAACEDETPSMSGAGAADGGDGGMPQAGAGGVASGGTGANGGRGGAEPLDGGGGGTAGESGTGGTGAGGSAGSGGDPSNDAAVPIDESVELYDPATLPRFDITLPPASIAMLNADPTTYVRGELRYGDEVVTDIGVRIKGEGSFRTLDGKSAFKLKMDEFVPMQTFRGLRRMTLNNMVEDPSYLAERLAYEVFRAAALPAPRCNSAVVYVNDEFYGVYANVETEDKTFLRRWFSDEDGNLYEEGGRDFLPGAELDFDLETNETADDRTDLRTMIEVFQASTAESFVADMSPLLDLSHFQRFSAAEALVNQWDMYGYTVFYPNNFRLYHDPTSDKFVFLPWGMDMSMKPFRDSGKPHIAIFELSRAGDRDGDFQTAGLVFQRCLEGSECRAQYAEAVAELVEVYEAADLEAKAVAYYEQIKPYVQMESTRRQYSDAEFEAGYDTVISTIRERPEAVRDDLAAE